MKTTSSLKNFTLMTYGKHKRSYRVQTDDLAAGSSLHADTDIKTKDQIT